MFNHQSKKRSFYEVLEIETSATIEEIKESYARAKSTYTEENPALYGMVSGNEREETLQLIEEAFRTLSSPEAKKEYDSLISKLNNPVDSILTSESARDPEFTLKADVSTEPQATSVKKQVDNFEQQSIKRLIETNKYQLNFDLNEEFEKVIREATLFDGEFLKQVREYKNVSIEKMSEMTRISKTNIKNIESENTEPLPALVYVRGFVYQYAKCLKLNPELVASSYIHQLKKKQNI